MMIYIAGPMTGYLDFNYPAFNAAAEELRLAGYTVLNPVDAEQHNDTGKPQEWDWYMRHTLRMVLAAEGLALLPGWANSKGAALEVHVATALGLQRRRFEAWLGDVA